MEKDNIDWRSTLRRYHEPTGLYRFTDVFDFVGEDGDVQSFVPADGWEWCEGKMYDIEKTWDGRFLVVLNWYDDYGVRDCSEAFGTFNTLDEARDDVAKREQNKDMDDGHIVENRFLFGW